MRTDTKTFARRAFKAVRALGVNSVRSRDLANQIVRVAKHGGYTAYGERVDSHPVFDAFRVELVFAFGGNQCVQVHDGDERVLTVSTNGGEIVSTEATPRQLELAQEMDKARRAFYRVSGRLCNEWADRNGYPDTFEAAERRHQEISVDPAYIAARSACDAIAAESLAINRYAPAAVIDSYTWSTFSDWHKEETGSRPHVSWRYADMIRWMERQSSAAEELLAA